MGSFMVSTMQPVNTKSQAMQELERDILQGYPRLSDTTAQFLSQVVGEFDQIGKDGASFISKEFPQFRDVLIRTFGLVSQLEAQADFTASVLAYNSLENTISELFDHIYNNLSDQQVNRDSLCDTLAQLARHAQTVLTEQPIELDLRRLKSPPK